ncbi:MAG: DUF4157 domain-containing protein [Bacteroidetes bacterium]|nr:DUF4157 domain-containing protein [Bacteroidota bacterium]
MYSHDNRSGDLADIHRAMRAKDVQRKKEKGQKKSESVPVSHPDDPSEKQAEHIARKVVDGGDAKIHPMPHAASPTVHANHEGEHVSASHEFTEQLHGSKGSGSPLPAHVQRDMGSKMGADFSDVKIHTGSNAHEMSESINARAFTHGQDIYFKNGNYDPASAQGKELLAHELVHTRQQKGAVNRKIQRQPKTKGTLTLKFKPGYPYYMPEDETYQHKFDYKDSFKVSYNDPQYGKIYTDRNRVQVEDAYVMDLNRDNIPAQPSGGKAFVYRRVITVDLKDGRSVHIVMDMVNIPMDDKVSMDSKGLTRFKYSITVYGGQTKVLPREGQGELGGVSINDLITKMSTTGNIPLELLQNSPLNQHYLLTAKQFADGLTVPATATTTQSGPVTWDKMSPTQKKAKALRDILDKVSFKNILINAIIAIIGVVVLAIIAVLVGWEIAAIVALIVLVAGFLMEFFSAKDDEV